MRGAAISSHRDGDKLRIFISSGIQYLSPWVVGCSTLNDRVECLDAVRIPAHSLNVKDDFTCE